MGEIQLPPRWKIRKLGEVCLNKTLTNPQKSPEDTFTYVDVSGVSNESFKITDSKEILGKNAPSRAKQVIHHNDVIFATVRPTLKRVALIPPELDGQICSTGFCILRSDPKYLYSTYIYFFLLTNRINQRVEALQKGVTYPAINNSDLFGQDIFFPPLAEQKTIAHTLRTIQKAKETRQRELELEREHKAALMQYLFTHGTRNEPRDKKKIGKIPESWGIVPFKSITVSGTQNGIYKSKEFYGRGYQIADMKEIFKGEILEIGNMDKLDLDDDELAKFRLYEGDLIFARRSFKPEGAGKCQFIPTLKEPVVFSSSIIRVSLNKEIAEPRFYAYFFNSEIGNQLIRQITRILAVSGISGSDLKNLLVPVLTQKEQKEIVATLQACDRKIQALEKEIALTDELFHAMLEQLMTGKISTQPLSETYV